jgi:hypothetical protein
LGFCYTVGSATNMSVKLLNLLVSLLLCKYLILYRVFHLFLTDIILHMWLVLRALSVIGLRMKLRLKSVFQDKDKMDALVPAIFLMNSCR